MTFDEKYKYYLDLTENYLSDRIVAEETPQGRVSMAMRHSLCGGGKRIRAVLTLEFYALCGGINVEKALPIACAAEMLHAFSLIHDDLPCMDNDDLRRGKPSCHKAFDEPTALLAGDALAIYPFELIAKECADNMNALKIISDLAGSVGVYGMIGGQQIDKENEGKSLDSELLLSMYSMKTGALLRSVCRIGCLAAGADEKMIMSADRYGKALGLAFQLEDDILDVEGSEQLLGKPIGSDAEQDKQTYVALFGIDNAKKKAAELTEAALSEIKNYRGSEFLLTLTGKLLGRSR